MAFLKGSAYENTPEFAPDDAGKLPFRGIRARRLRDPDPVLEHTVALRDRLDSVAHAYYAEGRDWRWLAEVNPDALFPEDLLWTDEERPGEDVAVNTGSERTGRLLIVPRRKEVPK
jgi:hypothetical protein